jgi:hypothetical protein
MRSLLYLTGRTPSPFPTEPEHEFGAESSGVDLAETDEDRALVGKQGGSQPLSRIVTDDCMTEYRLMKNAGVKFHGEPKVEPYGTGVTLEDLYGHKIYMNQEPT